MKKIYSFIAALICIFFLTRVNGQSFENISVSVEKANGMPHIFVNGEKISRTMACLDDPGFLASWKIDQYSGAIDNYFLPLNTPFMFGWHGGDIYTYIDYEKHIDGILKKKPDARFFLYVGTRMSAPYYWITGHQDQLCIYPTGHKVSFPSMASGLWLKDSKAAVEKFVEHFENSKYAKHILGYNVIISDDEWNGIGESNSSVSSVFTDVRGDFSKPMLEGFRGYLRGKYHDDVYELREKWKNASVNFHDAILPTMAERESFNKNGFFWHYGDKNRGSSLVDYFEYYNKLNARMAIEYCKSIKKASNNKKLAGAMIGYTYNSNRRWGSNFPQTNGHRAYTDIMQSKYIDFVHSPYHRFNRGLDGTHYSQHAVHSVHLNNKLLFDRIDPATHLMLDVKEPSNQWESLQIFKRDVAYALTHNLHYYWLDHSSNLSGRAGHPSEYEDFIFDEPEMKEMIARLKQLTDQSTGGESVSEVAIFTSMEAPYYHRMDRVAEYLFVEGLRQYVMPGTGVPFDDYVLEDFSKVDKSYKVYIFPNAFYVPSEMRKNIREKLEEEGATAIWFYAPGYADESGVSLNNMQDLTGMEFEIATDFDYLIVEPEDEFSARTGIESFGSNLSLNGFDKKISGSEWPEAPDEEYKFQPYFYPVEDLEVFGRYKNNEKPALVKKNVNGSRSVFIGAPMVPSDIMKSLLEYAGVHIYSDNGNLVYANDKYLGCVFKSGGKHIIQLPERVTVIDLMTGNRLFKNTREIEISAKKGETRIFELQ